MLISILPKYAVAQVIGFLKGKSAIWISRMCGCQRNFIGQNFWATGYCVSTIGLDEDVVRDYIERQEDEDKKLDQLKMFEE
jgi:putative transposase